MGIGMLSDGLAPTPPMGWNSWNRFGIKIDEGKAGPRQIQGQRADANFNLLVPVRSSGVHHTIAQDSHIRADSKTPGQGNAKQG